MNDFTNENFRKPTGTKLCTSKGNRELKKTDSKEANV